MTVSAANAFVFLCTLEPLSFLSSLAAAAHCPLSGWRVADWMAGGETIATLTYLTPSLPLPRHRR